MSEDYLRLVPVDPEYVPSAAAQAKAHRLFTALFPGAAVAVQVTDAVAFIDSGSNLDRILCPSCGANLSLEWWSQAMDQAYAASRFRALQVTLPCCGQHASLNDLAYEGAVGFARFVLEVRAPGHDLTDQQVARSESLVGCHLRTIWAHY
ncbi:MAG TPA: hypothetical protein VKT82_24495 [Ktedonobacterales bacterium]|nr:hypothetical protein [Ktedonobacterales bacterium]